MAQCTATSKRTGERCKKNAMCGKGVCHMHGGKSLIGAASGTFQHGRYSKHLPTRLVARFREAQEDPELLDLRHEIALTDALLTELLDKMDTGESGGLWRALEQAANAALSARARGEMEEATRCINALIGLVKRGAQEQEIVGEIRACLDQRRRLVESERKRMVEAGYMVSVQQSVLLLSAFLSVVSEHVKDRDTIAVIGRELDRLLARPDPALVG